LLQLACDDGRVDDFASNSSSPGHPPNDRGLARLATRQHGVVSLWQLRALGLCASTVRHRVAAGRLHRVHVGVYVVGYRRLSPRGRWLAAVLACGPGAVLSHLAALALWELRPHPPGPLDVTVVARGRRGPAGIRVHCVRALDPRDHLVRDAIPVTTVARALLDYAGASSAQQLRTALEAADRRDLLDTREIQACIARSPGRATRALTDALAALTGAAPWTRSELERAFLALIRAAGLPEPQANVLVAGHQVDFFWPAAGLVVEVDGYAFHRGRRSFESDRRRDTDMALAGLRTIRLTQRRIAREPERVQAELRVLLARA
jgi:very-short-patch-repair endonuclease/predicted transcriptional regulator of viral defense system